MEHTEIVRSAYEAHRRGDIEGIVAVLAHDVELISPVFGHMRGREAVRGYFERLDRMFELHNLDTNEFIAQEGTVVAVGSQRSRMRETGRFTEFQFAHVFTMDGGKVSRLQMFNDTAAIRVVMHESQAERAARD